jgi:hypothetical protein
VNEADMRQRLKVVKPIAVHLVNEGVVFEQITACWHGQSSWFEEVDRRTDLIMVETLQSAIKQLIPTKELQFKGITQEIRTVYQLASEPIQGFAQPQQDERRLRKALQMGGGELRQFHDCSDY